MTGSGQGKTQAGELLIQKSQLNFHGLCTLPILEAKCSQKILFRKWIELWLLFSCVIFNKYHTFMGWVADRSNESNLDLSNLRSKYLRACHRPLVSWLSGGYFYDYGLNALRGIACLDLHNTTLFIHTRTGGRVSLEGKQYFEGKFPVVI